ncbi:MAG TPA: hypothetical protein VKS20_15645 [Candidatus Acidoferrales bacterium]|nr:hypothetical protein [Candidatus Acidoferrales bacterium]
MSVPHEEAESYNNHGRSDLFSANRHLHANYLRGGSASMHESEITVRGIRRVGVCDERKQRASRFVAVTRYPPNFVY